MNPMIEALRRRLQAHEQAITAGEARLRSLQQEYQVIEQMIQVDRDSAQQFREQLQQMGAAQIGAAPAAVPVPAGYQLVANHPAPVVPQGYQLVPIPQAPAPVQERIAAVSEAVSRARAPYAVEASHGNSGASEAVFGPVSNNGVLATEDI